MPSGNPGDVQSILALIDNWVDNNGICINASKSKRAATESNFNKTFSLRDTPTPSSGYERDLGTIICFSFSTLPNTEAMVLRASRSLNLLLRDLGKFHRKYFTRIYTAYVRTHLELNIQACAPSTLKECRLIEGVQRRATKQVYGLSSKPYTDRLKSLDLYSLAFRRVRGDMIMTHRI